MDFSIEDVKYALAQWSQKDREDFNPSDVDEDDIDWSESSYAWSEEDPYDTGFGKLWVYSEEGGEGQGDYAEIIYTVDGRRFFRKQGSYYSYDGFDWDGPFREVFPKEKTITVFEEAA